MRIVLRGLLALIAVCGGAVQSEALPVSAPGSRMVSVDFMAVEDHQEHGVWRLVAGGGVGFPNMDRINDYVSHINNNFEGSVDRIERCQQFRLGLEREIAPRWTVGLAYERIEAEAKGRLQFMGATHQFSLELEVDGAEVLVRKRWPGLLGPVDVEALAGAGYYQSRYVEKENGYKVEGRDEAFGFRVGAGLQWVSSKDVGLFMEASYRWLTFDRYTDDGDTIRFVAPGNPPVEANFSGPTVQAGVIWRF